MILFLAGFLFSGLLPSLFAFWLGKREKLSVKLTVLFLAVGAVVWRSGNSRRRLNGTATLSSARTTRKTIWTARLCRKFCRRSGKTRTSGSALTSRELILPDFRAGRVSPAFLPQIAAARRAWSAAARDFLQM